MPQPNPIQLVASVLSFDLGRLAEECVALEKAGIDGIQWDVMDGRFVPNLTFGPDVIASVRDKVSLPFEAHLMVEEPDSMAARYAQAGCQRLIVHVEACPHLHRTLSAIADLGVTAGVALNPATPLEAVVHVLDLVDLVLIMTVNPGFGGQTYLKQMEPKISQARSLIDSSGRQIHLEVDGGIAPETAVGAVQAGADTLIAGSTLTRDQQGLGHAIDALRQKVAEV